MEKNFQRSLALVLESEGGWADHPRDPGGATMKGVTLATYRQYYPNATKSDLRNISNADLGRIYRAGYWNKVKGDQLPGGVDFAVFDFAVNSGPGRAIKYLQAVVGTSVDGVIGPATLKAVNSMAPATIVRMLCDRRMSFLRDLPTWDAFGRGWSIRVNKVQSEAMEMVERSSSTPIDPPEPAAPTPPRQEPAAPKAGIPSWIVVLGVFIAAAAAVLFFSPIF